MTYPISDVTRRVVYSGSAGVGPYSFSFEILDEGDIAVYENDTLLTITTDYTVTINADGTGSVTLVSASTASDTVSILGNKGIERQTDFVTGGDLFANSLNDELDAQTIFAQQNAEGILRSLRAPVTDPTTVNMELPVAADRAGTVLGFNATTGDPEAGPTIADVGTLAAITADISTLADIEDGTDATDAIQTVAGISSNVTTVAGISSNVTAVAGNATNINAVAADATDIGTVATNIASVNTVATNIADVITVANDLNEAISEIETAADDLNEAVSEIDTVAVNIANVNTVGTNISNVNTVAGISSDVTAVAADATDIGTVSTNIANVNTVATNITNVNAVAGNATNINAVAADATDIGTVSTSITGVNTVAGSISNVNTVAGLNTEIATVSGISGNVSTVAGISSNVTTVAGISSNVTTVAGAVTNINTVATNIADVNNFAAVYRISATAPTTSLDEGDLWYDSTANTMKVYDGSSWASAYVPSGAYVLTTGDTMTGNLSFGDNNKAIFGAGSDLQIYHDGSHSYIKDAGDGYLRLLAGTNVQIWNADATKMAANFNGDTQADLRYAGNIKLTTTSTGIDVTGTVTADGLTVDDDQKINLHGGVDSYDDLLRDTTGNSTIIRARNDVRVNIDSNSDSTTSATFVVGYDGLDTATKKALEVKEGGDISFYEDTGTTPKFFWDASAERLGIGTSSPSSGLEVYGTDAASGRIEVTRNTSSMYLGSTGAGGYLQTPDANPLMFYTNGTERMRIDSSGNLLVGNTAVNPASGFSNQKGFGYNFSTGQTQIATDANGVALVVGKNNTNDGSIIDFRKESSTVGSIGTIGGKLFISSPDGLTGGLKIRSNMISPCSTNGSDRDNAIDLGESGTRFKNLYLSGGVYLGGTGSANYLDDYEEGTWTPALTIGGSSAGLVYSSQQGTYVKVGEMMTASCYIGLSNKGSNAGPVIITGMPFNSYAGSDRYTCSAMWLNTSTGLSGSLVAYCSPGDNKAKLYMHGTGSISSIQNTNLTNTTDFMVTFTYRTA